MKLSRTILNKPYTILTFFVVLSIAGAFLTRGLAMDLYPNVEIPILAVITTYPMATPSEVEENVTRPVEEQLVNISGLKSMRSTSSDSNSMVILEMDLNEDIGQVTDQVRDKLELIKTQLPENCSDPYIFSFDPNSNPILDIALQGDLEQKALLTLVEDEIKPRLERITGVAQLTLSGGSEEILQVDIYRDRLDALGLSISQIAAALGRQNTQLGAGALTEGDTKYMIQTSGQITDLFGLSHTVIAQKSLGNGSVYEVLLRDVADVTMGTREQESRVLINGEPGILISLQKTDEANMVAVVDKVQKELARLNRELPGNTQLLILSDNSQQVRSTLSQVMSSAYWGILFAVIVLLFFLRQARSTLIIALSIPISLLITMGGMSLGGKTFNIMTLVGLVLALGMIVDGSIVILENIYRYRQNGVSLQSAAELGTQEMISPIAGSILTSISVFVPLMLFKRDMGIIGMMFDDMAFTIILALVVSLAVAVLLVPVLAAKVFPIHTREEKPLKNKVLKGLDQGIEKALSAMTGSYRKAVSWCLKHPGPLLLFALLLLAGSVFMLPRLGMVVMPPAGETSIVMEVRLPEGTPLDETEEVMLQWQSIIERDIPERNNLSITSGFNDTSYVGRLSISLPAASERERTDDELKSRLRLYFEMFPDGKFSFISTDQSKALSGGSDLSLAIKSHSMDHLISASEDFQELIQNDVPEVAELRSNQSNALPELELVLDRNKLYDLGLNTQTIAYELRALITGVDATTITLGDDSYEVLLRLREEDRDSALDIEKLFLLSPLTGEPIPFSSFGSVKKTTGPVSIHREDRVRTITLDMDLVSGAKASMVQKKIDSLVAEKLMLPDGVEISKGGQMQLIDDTLDSIWMVLVFAALMVFAVMVSQFESLKAPFIIFMMIPMLLIGVVALYMITGQTLSMPSMIGIVMLLGLVVNNGIIMVDAINLQRKRNKPIKEAILEASSSRLRPVLMTTATTVLAMVPMAFFPGKGAELVQPLGLTVIGGLVSNTLVTLFMVPIIYLALNGKAGKEEKKLEEAA